MREFCVLVFLGLNSWIDIKKREISLVLATMLAAAGMIWTVYRGIVSIERLLPIMTGVSFLGISVITRGSMGMGDGWILLALGTVLMPEEFFSMLFAAMLISAAWAGILLWLFRKKGNTEIPFVPFLMLGYLGKLFLWR